jgi:hypothetical protein
MLKKGLLWFDDNPKRPLVEKLDEAAQRYEERFEVRPTLVHLNPAQAEGLKYKRLSIFGDVSLRRNYFLIGVDEGERVEAAPALVTVSSTTESAAPLEESPPSRPAPRSRRISSVASVVNRRPRTRRAS